MQTPSPTPGRRPQPSEADPLDADPPLEAGHVTCDACWQANPPAPRGQNDITLPQTSFAGGNEIAFVLTNWFQTKTANNTRQIGGFYLFLSGEWNNAHNGPEYLLLHKFRIIRNVCDHCWAHVVTLAWNKRCLVNRCSHTCSTHWLLRVGPWRHLCQANNLFSRKGRRPPHCEFVLVEEVNGKVAKNMEMSVALKILFGIKRKVNALLIYFLVDPMNRRRHHNELSPLCLSLWRRILWLSWGDLCWRELPCWYLHPSGLPP